MKKVFIAFALIAALSALTISTQAQLWMPVTHLGFEIHLVEPDNRVFTTGDWVVFQGEALDLKGNAFTPEVRYFAIGPENFFAECFPAQKLGANAFVCDLEVTSNWPHGKYHVIMTGEKYPHPPQLEFKWNAFEIK